MKPVMQTEVGETGNCFSACLASLFELSIEEVPNFFHTRKEPTAQAWIEAVRDWLALRGYGYVSIVDPDTVSWMTGMVGHFIVSGISPRWRMHSTIWSSGEMVHDPHPEGGGIIEPYEVDLVYPLFGSTPAGKEEGGAK